MKNKIELFSLMFILAATFFSASAFSETVKTQDAQPDAQASQARIDTTGQDGFYNDNWDPFEEMGRMQRHMSYFFNQSMKHLSDMSRDGLLYQPDIDVQEKVDKYIVRMDLPGMQKDQIQLDATDKSLAISGERKIQTQEENVRDGYYRMERNFGSFHRSVPFEHAIKTEAVTAKYEEGVLEVDLPKVETKTASSRAIKID